MDKVEKSSYDRYGENTRNLQFAVGNGESLEEAQLFEEQWNATQDPSGICLEYKENHSELMRDNVDEKQRDPPSRSEIKEVKRDTGLSVPPSESTDALNNVSRTDRQETHQQQSIGPVPLVPVIPVDRTAAFIAGEDNESVPLDGGQKKSLHNQWKKYWIFCSILTLVTVAAIVGGVCGSGKCSSKNDSTGTSFPSQAPTAKPTSQFQPFTSTQELYMAVDLYLSLMDALSSNMSDFNSSVVCVKYGCPIGSWNVANIKDFSGVFDPQRTLPLTSSERRSDLSTFNEDISEWDVSSATSLSRMFAYASHFDGDLSGWDVSLVESMFGTFFLSSSFTGKSVSTWITSSLHNLTMCFDQAGAFDSDLGGWDVSQVGDLKSTFEEAKSFTGQGLENWKTGNVSSLLATFKGTSSFTSADLSQWDTSQVTNMEWCFAFSPFNDRSITSWNTSQVTSMSQMFTESGHFNQHLSWDTQKVKTMDHMFENARDFNQLLQLNTSGCTSMNNMFALAAEFNQPLTFDTSRVTSMENMFLGAQKFNQFLDFDTSNVISMENMFAGATEFNQPLNFDTSQVTSMATILQEASSFNQMLSWNTSNVQNMEQILYRAYSFNGSGLQNWDVSKVENLKYAFAHLPWFSPDLSRWQTGNVQNLFGTFWNCSSFQSDLSAWQTGNVLDLEATFYHCPMFESNLSQWDVSKVTSTSGTFEGATRFASDLSGWNVSSVQVADAMFYGTQFNADISNWDVSHIKRFDWMFGLAENFSQSLCDWGNRVMPTANVSLMFYGTACESEQDPEQETLTNGTVQWIGPWCSPCTSIPMNNTWNHTL